MNLINLIFGDKFNKVVYNKLPQTLILIKFGYNFNQDVSNLTHLKMILHWVI